MIADWIKHKPKINDGTLPVLLVDYLEMPKIAEGIWHAQMAGWGRILTYDHVQPKKARKKQKDKKRRDNRKDGFENCDLTMDEYPFASTKENTGSTFLTNASTKEQSKQGGQLHAFLQCHGAYTKTDGYFFFEVKVINYLITS